MDSPLARDVKTMKEFGIDQVVDVEPEFKLMFARSQRDEIQKALWRERIDLLISQQQLDSAEDDNVKAQYQSKVAEKRMLVKQFVRSVRVLNDLIAELETNRSE